MAGYAVLISATVETVFLFKPGITRNLNYTHRPMFLFPESENSKEWLNQRAHFSTQFSKCQVFTEHLPCVGLCARHPRNPSFPTLGTALLPWVPPTGISHWGHRAETDVAQRASVANLVSASLLPIFLKVLLEWTFPVPVSPILTVELWWKLPPRLPREAAQAASAGWSPS